MFGQRDRLVALLQSPEAQQRNEALNMGILPGVLGGTGTSIVSPNLPPLSIERRGMSWIKKHWSRWSYLRLRMSNAVTIRGGKTGWIYKITKTTLHVTVPLPGKKKIKIKLCVTLEGAAAIDRYCTLQEYIKYQEDMLWEVANII